MYLLHSILVHQQVPRQRSQQKWEVLWLTLLVSKMVCKNRWRRRKEQLNMLRINCWRWGHFFTEKIGKKFTESKSLFYVFFHDQIETNLDEILNKSTESVRLTTDMKQRLTPLENKFEENEKSLIVAESEVEEAVNISSHSKSVSIQETLSIVRAFLQVTTLL